MRWQPGFSGALAAAAVAVWTAVAMPAELARAQELPAAQALPAAKDTIFARKILMGAIDMNMDEIETMLAPEGKLDLAEAQEHSETISTMLMAFPHMFPPATHQWKAGAARDPATDTFASPELWTNFADFYARATEASKLAWNASRARRASDFKALIVQLRERCNACHAQNLKVD